MDKKYIQLFKSLAQATAVSAEQVIEYDQNKNDDKGLETATIMRNDYQELVDRLTDDYQMTKIDATKLLVAAMIQVNQLQDRIDNLKTAMTGYQTDAIPKLEKIINDASNDDEAKKIANENFVIKDNK